MRAFILSDKLPRRQENTEKLQNLLQSNAIGVDVITDYMSSSLDLQKIKSLTALQKHDDPVGTKYNPLLRNHAVPEISKCLKHYSVLQRIKKQYPEESAFLVLEDDCSIPSWDDLLQTLSLFQAERTSNICFLSNPGPPIPSDTNHPVLIDLKLPILSTGAYLIKQEGTHHLSSKFIPILYHTAIHISYLIEMEASALGPMQTQQEVVLEGSKHGFTKSSTHVDNSPILSSEWKKLKAALDGIDGLSRGPQQVNDEIKMGDEQGGSKTEKEKNVTIDADLGETEGARTTTSSFMGKDLLASREQRERNVDFIVLQALLHFRAKEYVACKEKFDVAYDTYKSLGLSLTKDSLFMANYLEVFKYVQK